MDKVEGLYQELQLLVKSEQYEAATHICDKIRLLGCMDNDVLRTKIYCLIQKKMWNQALFLIKTLEKNNVELPFEKSYCLYRNNSFNDALSTLEALGDPTKALSKLENRAISYLKIQILYRLGRFGECDKLYSLIEPILTKENNVEELEMLQVNRLAVFSSNNNLKEEFEDFDIPDYLTNSIEYWFNRCCLYLSNNDFDNAMTSLEMSESLYNSFLGDDDLEDQQHPNPSDECSLMLMRAFIMQQMGQDQEAVALYDESFKKFGLDGVKLEPSMVHLGVVAFNNCFSLKNGTSHGYIDGLKRLSITSKDNIQHKLTLNQNFIICLNKALALFNEGGFKYYIKEAEKFSVDPLKLELFKIGLFILQGKAKKAVQYIDTVHRRNPNNIEFFISVIKILLKLKMTNHAIKILDSIVNESLRNFEQLTISPELFDEFLTLIQNILTEKFSSSALEMIKQKLKLIQSSAISQSVGNRSNSKLASLLCVLGKHLLITSLPEEAAECFRFVLEDLADSENEDALSGYVTAYTLCGYEVSRTYLRQLDKKLPKNVFSMDAEILEKMEAPTRASDRDDQSSRTLSHTNLTIKKKPKHKKRKPRYPKGFDPLNPGPAPDPERWLPKEQRLSFRKLNKNRNNKRGQTEKGRHQGAMPSANEIKANAPSTAKQAAMSSSTSFRRSHRKKRR
ncbi:signal recognition particle SPR72 [Cryptosporidium canis]|uniref:Signal recognition particle subunit SRP72 n=1 Tax=Cryptosporidium canis TaxID=195482 RepID=A0A9D5DJR1_9CRYT|nr:signal recognition particle SPR72 [Cryptosporidium canis]